MKEEREEKHPPLAPKGHTHTQHKHSSRKGTQTDRERKSANPVPNWNSSKDLSRTATKLQHQQFVSFKTLQHYGTTHTPKMLPWEESSTCLSHFFIPGKMGTSASSSFTQGEREMASISGKESVIPLAKKKTAFFMGKCIIHASGGSKPLRVLPAPKGGEDTRHKTCRRQNEEEREEKKMGGTFLRLFCALMVTSMMPKSNSFRHHVFCHFCFFVS